MGLWVRWCHSNQALPSIIDIEATVQRESQQLVETSLAIATKTPRQIPVRRIAKKNEVTHLTSTMATVLGKLVTHEDPWHVHKTLGGLCVVSYAWRFALTGSSDMGFRSHPSWTIPTLALHLLLNLSSFVFRIPKQRIKSDGYRIWPEYRLHSLVFLCRSMAYMLLIYYEDISGKDPDYRLNLVIVLLACGAADLSSLSQGRYRSPTIRGFDTPFGVQYFFSVAQMLATSACIWGLRRYSTQFAFCWIIQLNAFFMTLRRKNIGSHRVFLAVYGSMLVMGGHFANVDHVLYGESTYAMLGLAATAHTAALLRLGPRLPGLRVLQDNKYLMWTAIYLLAQQLRTVVKKIDDENDSIFLTALVAYTVGSLVLVILNGVNKHKQAGATKDSRQTSSSIRAKVATTVVVAVVLLSSQASALEIQRISMNHLSRRAFVPSALVAALRPTSCWSQDEPVCDEACLADRKRRIEERRAMMRQSRSPTSRQEVFELSRQRALLYNTTYQGTSCPPGIPCL